MRDSDDSTDSVSIVSTSSTTRKRPRSCSDSVTTTEPKKRSVSHSIRHMSNGEVKCQTLSWLDCNLIGKKGKRTVNRLNCKVCLKYKSRIESMRNYCEKWIVGADSVRTSNVRDHARSDQHQYAMSLHCKESGSTAKAGEPSSRNVCTMLQKLSEGNRAVSKPW